MVAARSGRRQSAEIVMKMIAAIQAGARNCRNGSSKGVFASGSWIAANTNAKKANEKGSSEWRVVPRARMNAPSIEGTRAIAELPARNAKAPMVIEQIK